MLNAARSTAVLEQYPWQWMFPGAALVAHRPRHQLRRRRPARRLRPPLRSQLNQATEAIHANFLRCRAPRRHSAERRFQRRLSLLHAGPRTSDRGRRATASSCSARPARSSSTTRPHAAQIIEHAVKVATAACRSSPASSTRPPTGSSATPRAAQAAGVDAVVVTAPFYTRTSQAEIVDHFRYVKDAVDLPDHRLRHPGLRPHQARAQDRGDARQRRRHRRPQGLLAATTATSATRCSISPATGRLPDDRLGDRRRQRA